MLKTKAVKIELYVYCDNYNQEYIWSDFSTVNGTIDEKKCGIKYICGAGKIISCDDTLCGLLPGRKVAFCGFIDGTCSDVVEVPDSCVVPMDDKTPYKNVIYAGLLMPIIATLNAVSISLGENIMVVCDDKYLDVTSKLIQSIGCTPVIVNRTELNEPDELINKVLLCTSGYGADAVIFLYKADDSIKYLISKMVCPNRSRIVFADGIGIGSNDRDFMCSKKPYPAGYTGNTPKDNLEFSLRLLRENEELSRSCKTILKNAVFLKKDEHTSDDTNDISDRGLTDDQNKLKILLKKRRGACLFQMTVRKSDISDAEIDILERIAVSITGSKVASKRDICSDVLASRTVVLQDGSVAIINCLKYLKEKTRIELHWDGKTTILENDIVTTYM